MVRHSASVLFGALAAIFLWPAITYAASSQAFQVLSGQPQMGMIMSQTTNPDVVEPANQSNAASMIGVVSPNSGNIDQTPGSTNVQTDGETKVLVSTLGGNLLVGDKITSSALQGIGQKLNGSGWVIGTAEASLDSSTQGAVLTTVTDNKGAKHQVYVTLIPVVVHVTYYGVASNNNWTPQTLQKIANSLAGKNVSTTALIFSFLLFLIGLATALTIIIAAVRNGFNAIARQPLSKFVIIREEWRSFGAAMAILVFVLVGSILMLKFL